MVRISRELERAERRRMREAASQMRAARQMANAQQKMAEQHFAALAVEEFESTLAVLSTVHRECSGRVDWKQMLHAQPHLDRSRSTHAQAMLQAFTPTLFERIFGSVKRREDLERALAAALAYEASEWDRICAEVEEGRQLASRVLAGDTAAYNDAIKASGCLQELEELGCSPIGHWIDSQNAWTTVKVGGPDIVPNEAKALTASGKLSTKRVPAGKQNEIYQDFVCGVALRIARELTAVLPIRGVLCDVQGPVFDATTGHTVDAVILSVYCPAERLISGGVNFTRVDASDLISTFMHAMKLVKTKGFQPVTPLPHSAVTGVAELTSVPVGGLPRGSKR
jgi:hypothetical protein